MRWILALIGLPTAVLLSGCLAAVPLAVMAGGAGIGALGLKQASDAQHDRDAQYRAAAADALHVEPGDVKDIQVGASGFRKEWIVRVSGKLYYCAGTGTPIHGATCKAS